MGYLARRRRRGPDGQVHVDRKWTAFWRDCRGRLHSEAAYTDKASSKALLAKREQEAREGREEFGDPFRKWRRVPLKVHTQDFLTHLAANGVGEAHRAHLGQHLRMAFKAMGARFEEELSRNKVEACLLEMVEGGGLRWSTRNHRLAAISQLLRWGVEEGRWRSNCAETIKRLKAVADPGRRQRRPLTAEELERLIVAARERPVVRYAATHPDATEWELARLRLLGVQRMCLYTVAALAGLRRKELKALRWVDVRLDGGRVPCLVVRAQVSKGRREDIVELAPAAVAALREWREVAAAYYKVAIEPTSKIYDCVTHGALPALRADCEYAGVPVETADGIVDLHSLRHTTCTLLCRAGVPVHTAQHVMRHRDARTTLGVYAHVQAQDRADAVARLPLLGLVAGQQSAREREQ